jgi:hypothetical protein
MEIDIDANGSGEDYILHIVDGRFSLAVFVSKATFPATIAGIKEMRVGDEVVLGVLGSGPRVWLIRDSEHYAFGIGDTDSKDVSYILSREDLSPICDARPEA